jgi:hypothetical protein
LILLFPRFLPFPPFFLPSLPFLPLRFSSLYRIQMLFDLAIELKRIEVIADDEDEIVEAVRRMHKNYDLVITSGGIGPSPNSSLFAQEPR